MIVLIMIYNRVDVIVVPYKDQCFAIIDSDHDVYESLPCTYDSVCISQLVSRYRCLYHHLSCLLE